MEEPRQTVSAINEEEKRRVCLLGPVDVSLLPHTRNKVSSMDGGRSDEFKPPRFRSRRTVALLGYLVAEQRAISRENLAVLLWPDAPTSKARMNLSRELYNLAQILPGCWARESQRVAFVPSPGTTVDLYDFSELEASERWMEAATLVTGEFLEGLYLRDTPEFENWLLGERQRWRDRGGTAMHNAIKRQTRHGNYTDALKYAQRLLQLAPWDEVAHRQAMRLLTWTGRRGAALRQFESCKSSLIENLDVEPAPETLELCQGIRDGSIDHPPRLPVFITKDIAKSGQRQPPFVGRSAELTRLNDFLQQTMAGNGKVIFVTGSPGRGKTALLKAFTQRAMDKYASLLVASGNCNAYFGVGDPYLPFRDVMAMLTGDVEGLWEAGTVSGRQARRVWEAYPTAVQVLLEHGLDLMDVLISGEDLVARARATGQEQEPWFSSLQEWIRSRSTRPNAVKQGQLFEQVTNVLQAMAMKRPLFLILDDIQWADKATISLLFHLGRRLARKKCRILIACAYRPEEILAMPTGQRHPLVKVLSEFKLSSGDIVIDLDKSDNSRDRTFLNALLEVEPNRLAPGFRNRMFDRTTGHPLFTLELIRAMQDRGDLIREEDGAWVEGPSLNWDLLPVRVEAVIAERLGRLEPGLREILDIASVEGEIFTANIVASVQGLSVSSTLHSLSHELEHRHRLVSEQEEIEGSQGGLTRYRFNHALFQEYLYNELGLGRQRLFHGKVALAMEMLHSEQLADLAVPLSRHFHQAGDHARALHYYSLAAQRAARLFANDEAISHFTRAIQLDTDVSSEAATLARLYHGRGVSYARLGDFNRALADYTTTFEIARDQELPELALQAKLELGRLWASRDYLRTHDYFADALEMAHTLDQPNYLADCLNCMGNWYANNGQFSEAVAYHQKALAIFEQLQAMQETSDTLDLLGLASLLAGQFGDSMHYYDRAIALSRELDYHPRLAACLTGRATIFSALVWLNSVPVIGSDEAIADIHEARRIAEMTGSTSEAIWTHWSMGLLMIVQAQFGRAQEELTTALERSKEIKHREWVVASHHSLGILYSELLAQSQARTHLLQALAELDELHSPTWNRLVRGALARVYMKLGEVQSACACLEEAISPQTEMDSLGKRFCWVAKAELVQLQNDPESTLDIADRLVRSSSDRERQGIITHLWKLKGEVCLSLGQPAEAREYLEAALKNAESAGERFLIWPLHSSLRSLFLTTGNLEAAEREGFLAQSAIDETAATISDKKLRDAFRRQAQSHL